MEVTVRLTVRKDKPYTKTPHFRTVVPRANTEEYYCTTGVDAGEPAFSHALLMADKLGHVQTSERRRVPQFAT